MKPIRTEAEYEAALARIVDLIRANGGKAQGEELNDLADLVCDYEDEHYPMGWPGPVAALEFLMDQHSLNPSDLMPYFGSLERVAEALTGARPVSESIAQALQGRFHMPQELFLHEETTDETTSADEATPAALAAAG